MFQTLTPENTPKCIREFIYYFENLASHKGSDVSTFYENSIEFQDPVHHLQSISELTSYFQKLNKNLKSGGFDFKSISISQNKCFLEWEMQVVLNRPNKAVFTSGISVLTFEDKITHHRDYFDAGELFYENVPIVGSIIRSIKRNLAK